MEVACAYTIVECVDNLEFGLGNLDWLPYSEINNFRFLKSKFQLPNSKINNSKPTYSFKVASYDTTKDLIIDPLLASTFLGGGSGEYINAIAIDKSGNIYVTGATWGGFPVTSGAYDIDYNGGHEDVFASKFSSDLTQLLASTYIGGTGSYDSGVSIAIDNNGDVYVAGNTGSDNFPTTAGAYDTSYNNRPGYIYDVFISKLNGDLTQLLASTYFGGLADDSISQMVIDSESEGSVYLTGTTNSYDFPATDGAFDTSFSWNNDGFVSILNGDLTTLLASTYLGGNNRTVPYWLTLDTDGNIYVTGYTVASDFPTTTGAYDTSYNGHSMGWNGGDVFVSKLNGALTTMLASTYSQTNQVFENENSKFGEFTPKFFEK